MKYRDLIHFEPVESVVELKGAAQKEYAFKLIDTYVISEHMAEVIDEVIIEQLQFNYPADNKGLFIVGNYGTGKSHLMSVISTIAETEGTSDRINNDRVAKRAKEIEGKFKVLRVELDGITMPFRDVLFQYMAEYMQEIGVDYELPDLEYVKSNKDELLTMMAAFNEVYPDHGFLLVIDELLDYLRSRKEQELILDLNFLRAMGEICRTTRFRFMAGVQEMLFDNPTFQFVAQQLSRVKERMEQAVIVREDIEYVVSQRLLKKDEKQKALIREHLQKFTSLYDKLNEQLEKYVELFPVHPAYLSTFEKVSVAEKRVILKTISQEMKKLMDKDVPDDHPGLISYDSYWPHIEGDRSLKNNSNVKAVMSKVNILLDRIDNAFTRPAYRPMAKRIVQALAVFRLTTDDIHSKVGVTADELRDHLFLYADLPEQDAEFLRTTIESVLKEILKTVSYQYISVNQENGQYYLDIDKDIDVDSLIEQKAETLSDHQLDRYYFDILAQVTDSDIDRTYVTGFKIWSHELEWYEKRVTRPGYLFFGAPNERSTAQPERDFYIYMLQPFDPPKFKDEEKPDEVFFKLDTKDETFIRNLQLYAGAKEMALAATSGTRRLYEEKANTYLKQLVKWLTEHMPTAYKITYRGETKKLAEWSFAAPARATVREMIDTAAGDCLSAWFNEKYPDYPAFSKVKTPITSESMKNNYIPEALKNIPEPKTKNGIAILDGLVLLDNGKLNVHQSGYARWVLDLLEQRGEGQVINASELIEIVQTHGSEEVKRTVQFQLEPELFMVVLAAMVFNGDIVITINGTTYDAMKFDELIKLPLDELVEFSHIKKPSELPLPALRELFNLFNIPQGLLNQNALTQGIGQLRIKSEDILKQVAALAHDIRDGIPVLNTTLLDRGDVADYRNQLNQLKDFLQNLQVYNTPAKLKHFKYTAEEVKDYQHTLQLVTRLEQLKKRAEETSKVANYIELALNLLPANHPWQDKAERALSDLIDALKQGDGAHQELQALQQLKAEYQDIYMAIHAKARLSATEDAKKQQLLDDPRHRALEQLSAIDILSKQQLHQWQQKVNELKPCWQLTRNDLEHSPLCPHCKLRPKDEQHVQYTSLEELENQLQDLLDSWTETLLTNFKDPEIKQNISLLKPEQQQLIGAFINHGEFSLPLNVQLIQAIQELLQGIEKIELTIDDLVEMMAGGNPLTVEDLRRRFENMMTERIGASTTKNIRIMLNLGKEGKHESF